MISPIHGQAIEFSQNRVDTEESTDIKGELGGDDESSQNKTFDPFNQGFGAFGDESQSQIMENPEDLFKKESEPGQSTSAKKEIEPEKSETIEAEIKPKQQELESETVKEPKEEPEP
jgi:hypothetical protein